MVDIQTERLVLRELKEADWQAVHGYASAPEVVRYMDWGPNTEDDDKSFIRPALPTKRKSLAETLRLPWSSELKMCSSAVAEFPCQTQRTRKDGLVTA